MNIISKLFNRCQHEWETKMTDQLTRSSRVSPNQKWKVGEVAYCQCKKCGEWKLFKMMVEAGR